MNIPRKVWWPLSVLAAATFVAATMVELRAQQAPADVWQAPARAARKKNPIPADAAAIAAGKAVYTKECLSCHGAAGRGDGPNAKDLEKSPGDLSKPTMWEQTDGALFWKITEGRKPMPSFEKNLSEDQRWQVIDYARTLAPKPATQPDSH